MDYSRIITTNPAVRGGKPCVRGLRVTVSDVLEYLASGMSEDAILADFPYLTREDIRACLAFATEPIEARLNVDELQVRGIKQGIASLDAGRGAPHAEVKNLLASIKSRESGKSHNN